TGDLRGITGTRKTSVQVSETRSQPSEAFSASQADNAGSIPVIRSRQTKGQVVRGSSNTWPFLFPGSFVRRCAGGHPSCPRKQRPAPHPRHSIEARGGQRVHPPPENLHPPVGLGRAHAADPLSAPHQGRCYPLP